MGREETVHNKINRRRRSQIWHQWYDGRASTSVKHASYKAVELPNLAIVAKMTVLGSNKCVLKTQRFFFRFFGIDYQQSHLYFSNFFPRFHLYHL